MLSDVFYIKQNDLQPYYYGQVKDSAGNAVSITGAVVVCTMKSKTDGTLKINRQSAGVVITDGANGLFEYRWQAGDTGTVGAFSIEFEFTPPAGGKFTLPVDPRSEALVVVRASLDTL